MKNTVFIFAYLVLGLLLALSSISARAESLTGAMLAKAAKQRTKHLVIYDGSYKPISYPGGDVSKNKGVCTDVLIRSYRQFGVDLQQLVHEDMREHFSIYPKRWGLKGPDTNIDHRRVPNLETFFRRHGQSLPLSDKASDFKPGDIVSWRLSGGQPHIGIVSSKRTRDGSRNLIIHNIGWGPKEEDRLFAYEMTGHFRYLPAVSAPQ